MFGCLLLPSAAATTGACRNAGCVWLDVCSAGCCLAMSQTRYFFFCRFVTEFCHKEVYLRALRRGLQAAVKGVLSVLA